MAKTMYKIQLGAYRQKSNAQKMAAKLKKAGIPATIITAGDLMKVQCGAFSVKANADKRLTEVKKKGFLNTVLITVPGTEKTASAPVVTTAGRIRIAALAFFDTGNEAQQYGDCTALIQYGQDDKTVEHAVLIDTAMAKSSANVIKKLKALGVKKLDAIIISHAHGDHYGGVTNIKAVFPTADIYVPDSTGLDKYQKTYGDALRSQYKKAKGHYIKPGTVFTIGAMRFECVYLCPASSLKEHDSHHFVNNQSAVMRINLNSFFYGRHVVFTGKLEKMVRQDAMQIVVNLGGILDKSVTKHTNYLILGNNDYNAVLKGEKSSKHRKAEKLKLEGQDIEIIDEYTFYDIISE